MNTIYHQMQGLYTAGDVLCAVDCVRALPDFRHVFFVNHDHGFDRRILDILTGSGVTVRRNAIVTAADLTSDLRAVFYHCVGYDDRHRGAYVSFDREPPGVKLCAWIHTPGLCGERSERYNYLRDRGCSCLIFCSSFSLQNTPGLELDRFPTRAIINPSIDTDHYAGIQRIPDGAFRIGRWSRGADAKYSDDFLELLSSVDIPGAEFVCMGIPGKFRGADMPARVQLIENGAMPVESLLAQLDVLIFKTHAPSWHEGWCRTVTEAMAAGVVPVVENRGGIPDQVIHGYNGFLCDSNAEFKYYCEWLYRNPAERARLSANAREFACKSYSLSNLRQDLLQLLEPRAPRRLDWEYGSVLRPGYVNFETHSLPGADLVAPLDPFYPRLPFEDEEFDEIVAFHVLEHVANKAGIIEELWRVARHNALMKIKLPDRNHSDAFLDPTHLSYWEVDTIDFYLPGYLRNPYFAPKFGLLRKYTTSREIYWELIAIRRRPVLPYTPPIERFNTSDMGRSAK